LPNRHSNQDYIQKPIVPSEIIARVKVRLKQSKDFKQLKEIQTDSNQHISRKQAKQSSDKFDLALMNENFSRLNLLKKKELPFDQRKKKFMPLKRI